MMTTRGLGHRDEVSCDFEDDLRCRHVTDLVGVGSPSQSSRDWRHLDPQELDQVKTNTCSAFSGSTSLYMRGQYAKANGEGDAIPRPSILHAYVYGGLEDQRIDGVPLRSRRVFDIGMRIRSMLLAWSTHGVISEQRWPFDPAMLGRLVNAPTIEDASAQIPFDLDIAAADAKLTGWHAITPGRTSIETALALDKGQFPILAIKVFQNFMDWTGARDYVEADGKYVGNHAMTAVAYRPGFTCLKNWWTRDFGDEGFVWISNDYLDGPNGLAGYLPTVAPALR